MPDLLAHALVAYTLCLALSWRYGWLGPAYRTVGMAGAFVPDITKAKLLLPSPVVAETLGLPFSWDGIHTLGGAFVAVLVGVALVVPRERRRVVALLALGAGSHLVADALLLKPTGHSYAVLWPLTRYHPPTPGLYLSTEPTPAVVAAVAAGAVWLLTRYRRRQNEPDADAGAGRA